MKPIQPNEGESDADRAGHRERPRHMLRPRWGAVMLQAFFVVVVVVASNLSSSPTSQRSCNNPGFLRCWLRLPSSARPTRPAHLPFRLHSEVVTIQAFCGVGGAPLHLLVRPHSGIVTTQAFCGGGDSGGDGDGDGNGNGDVEKWYRIRLLSGSAGSERAAALLGGRLNVLQGLLLAMAVFLQRWRWWW